jgi:HK97 family phage portal protein
MFQLSPPPTSSVTTRSRPLVHRMRAALTQWLGIPVELTNHAFWAEFNGTTGSGERVSVSAALRISTVWACVRLISETVSTLPFMLYARTPQRTLALKHPLFFLLHDSPNADMTAVSFWEVIVAAMLLWGNAYALIMRAGGNIVALEFIMPERMAVRRLPDGSLEYSWYDSLGHRQVSGDADILHIPAFSVDGVMGLSPVGYASSILGSAIAADRASGTFFQHAMMASGVFTTESLVKEGQREEFKRRLLEYQGAMNAGKSPLLEGGIKYEALSINPTDAQLLETRAFSIEEICRWYRVPPYMVGHSEKSTSWGTGLEQQNLGFLQYTLRPWLKRIEQAVNKKLLGPTERREYYSEFNFEALLRADSAGRSAFFSQMTQNGIYTRDEVRAKENLPPMGGNADVLTVQVNMTPLDKLGETPPQPQRRVGDTPPPPSEPVPTETTPA